MNGNGKVIGVGVPKTGTSTLRACFKILGIVPYASHRKDLRKAIDAGIYEALMEALDKAEHYRGLENSPWCWLFRELDQRFPGSKFILTTRRDGNVQAMSAWNHLLRKGRTKKKVKADFLASKKQRYDRHNAAVREYFKDRPHDLLEVCWEKDDGWPQLCEFLSLPVPDVPFPHRNRGDYLTKDTERFPKRPATLSRISKLKKRIFNR